MAARQATLQECIVFQRTGKLQNPLPEDLPAREALYDGGFHTVEQIADAEDLTAVDGVGKATAEKVYAYLEED